jgi:hypothetical protein
VLERATEGNKEAYSTSMMRAVSTMSNKYPCIDPNNATCVGGSVVRSRDNADENEDPNPVMLRSNPPILEQGNRGGFNFNFDAIHAPASPSPRKGASKDVPQTKQHSRCSHYCTLKLLEELCQLLPLPLVA